MQWDMLLLLHHCHRNSYNTYSIVAQSQKKPDTLKDMEVSINELFQQNPSYPKSSI